MKSETNFRKLLEPASRRHDTRTVFDGFVRLAACALAAETREAEYLEEAKRWTPDDLGMFSKALGCLVVEMQSKPFEDVIGGFYMEFALSYRGQQWNGEFHTPKCVCDMMARMTLGDFPQAAPEGASANWNEDPSHFRIPDDKETLNVLEPACGSGAMILSVGQAIAPQDRRRLRVTAIDINRTACDMCYINTTLWGIPCRVIHGNTLSMEFWHQWENLHWIMPWLPLAMRVKTEVPEPHREQGAPPKPVEVEALRKIFVQQELIPA